ncbi:hypothetical protein Pfo_007971 [Paulownia fortunei]|nr:hypothetical protein Pfo_007971 [Paulownia fortunei]
MSEGYVGVYNDENDAQNVEDSDLLQDNDYEMGNEISDDDELFETNVDQMEENELGGDIDNIDIDSSKSCESREKDIVDNDNDFDENMIGMIFGTKAEFRKVVQSYTIRTKRNLKFIKNDKIRVYVREYNPKHSCLLTFHVKNVKTNWLSERYITKFHSDLKRHVKGFRIDVINDIRCHVSKQQAYRAKRKALSMIKGNPDIQYSKLWDYAEELRKTNPSSTIILGTEEKNGEKGFNKFYVCFNTLKIGFLSGCRPIIGVDGYHLKGPHGGVLLTAVGVDPNNNLYSIAYVVVYKECRNTWEWFLIVLKNDLNIAKHHEYTFMSDKQKGLIQAFEEVFLIQITSFSHFNEGPKCDMLLNNICEIFNSNILDAREKLIITILEWIREYLMQRLQKNRDRAEAKWKGKLCPKIKKIIEKHIDTVVDCIPIKSDDRHYQVLCFDGSQYTVDLDKFICTCRQWGLSGIPCKHVICAILNQNELPEDYVHSCYNVETYKQVYRPAILGISYEQLWGEALFIPPLPPTLEGVKKKCRGNQTLKLKRQQTTVKCRLCGVLGHNSAICPSNLDNLTVNIDTRVTTEVVGEKKTNAALKSTVGDSLSGKNVSIFNSL